MFTTVEVDMLTMKKTVWDPGIQSHIFYKISAEHQEHVKDSQKGIKKCEKKEKLASPQARTRELSPASHVSVWDPNPMSMGRKSDCPVVTVSDDQQKQGVTRVRFSGRYKIEIESTHYRRDRDRDRDYNLL